MTINKGIRWSTARAYLRPIMNHRKNLFISSHSHVHRVLFNEEEENKRAIGVQYESNGVLRTVYCRKEIILSAGTVGSSKILLLSGIGPTQHLKEIGVSENEC